MNQTLAALALVALACGHAHDAEVVAAVEPQPTIGFTFIADTARLLPPGSANAPAGVRALAAVVGTHLAVVGPLRDDRVAADHLDVIADLPAPGWALRARLTPKPELLCQVTIEPVATAPSEHAATTAPWSVQDAFDEARRLVTTLKPSKLARMAPDRFARLRAEAAAAAHAGRDPLLSPSEYVRVPRPITDEGADKPYYVPPSEPSGLQGP
jgi:hypothetical protein